MQTETRKELLRHITSALVSVAAKSGSDLTEDKIAGILEQSLKALQPEDGEKFATLIDHALTDTILYRRPDVTEVRPQQLECDVVRFQNNKEKWVALVGLLDGYPYEIFTGLQDDEEGIVLPKTVTKGKTAQNAMTFSSRISVAIRPPWRACRRSSIPSTGTMPN